MTFFLALLYCITPPALAGIIHFKAPSISGKITTENLHLTDWRAVMTCHYSLAGKQLDAVKYPQTNIKKIEDHTYSINIKGQAIFEAAPNLELQNCIYKLLFIGKNKSSHQVSYGEVILAGTEKRKLNEQELSFLQNKENLGKVLSEKIKDLTLANGAEGGIISKENAEE